MSMIAEFILLSMERAMPRRTISISQATIDRVESIRREDESFSAAVARLIEAGGDVAEGLTVPSYVGIASGAPSDLSSRDEQILTEIFSSPDWQD
jgi:hypothetical protein